MIAPRTIALAAILALAGTGLEPAPLLTGEANASGRKAPATGTSKGTASKKRKSRSKSKSAASSKVSPAKKRSASSKKRSRKSSGKSAKSRVASGVPATPVASSAPRQSTSKSGSGKRASMTAVNGASMTQPRTTAQAGPGARASLDVNTAPRSPRSKTVTQASASRKAVNQGEKRRRVGEGYVAKNALKAPRLGGTGKVTFAATPKVLVFDNELPPNQLRGAPPAAASDAVSNASSVLTRRPMQLRSQGMFRRLVGKVANAVTFSRSGSATAFSDPSS